MQQISATRSRAYLTALSQEIQKKLLRAEATPAQRRNLLQELFADIALEVDDRAKDIILSRGAETIAPTEEGAEDPLCFYDVLSGHFIQVPEDGQPILDLIVKLWSQSFASHIFALLFHKWFFEVDIEDSEKLLRYSSALVEGSANVFWQVFPCLEVTEFRYFITFIGSVEFVSSWIDIQTNTRRFQSLFRYLLEDVTLDQSRITKLVLQAQRDLFLLLSRFIFFYNAVDKLGDFLNKFPTYPNSFLVGGPADIFVIELTDQLQKLKVEPVLLHYLSYIKVLQGLELRMTTSTRLKTCLYSFTSPGGPINPTRAVRHSAWDALDALFPVSNNFLKLLSACIGWAISSASHQSVLSAIVSMVLAIFLLAFCNIVYKSFVLFPDRFDSLKLGVVEGTQDVQERHVVLCFESLERFNF
ncbi:Nitrogenase molybdenum-iron protein alpha chain [Bienertia sinuspersici]